MRFIKMSSIFLMSFSLYFIFFSSFFPVDNNNVSQAPFWFYLIGIISCSALSATLTSKKHVRLKKCVDWIATFVLVFFAMMLVSEIIFQTSENGTANTPAWYSFAKFLLPVIAATLSANNNPGRKSDQQSGKKNRDKQANHTNVLLQWYKDASRKKAYENLSESEKWKLERQDEVQNQIHTTTKPVQASKRTTQSRSPYDSKAVIEYYKSIDFQQIIDDEQKWRREQQGMSESEYALSRVDNMSGKEFEHWCGNLLEKIGYYNVVVTPESGDQGVDVVAEKDGIRYAIQCKCYASNLDNSPVQEVNTGKNMPQYRCQIGVVMTNRYFTKGAVEAAEANGVLLWDRDKLKQMIEYSQL